MKEFLPVREHSVARVPIREAEVQDALCRSPHASRTSATVPCAGAIEFARAARSRAEAVHQPVKSREGRSFQNPQAAGAAHIPGRILRCPLSWRVFFSGNGSCHRQAEIARVIAVATYYRYNRAAAAAILSGASETWKSRGFRERVRTVRPAPQRLKPHRFFRLTARLKPCPDEKPHRVTFLCKFREASREVD